MPPIGAFLVGASFLIVMGTTKGLVLIGLKPCKYLGVPFKQSKQNKVEEQNGELLSS